MIEGERLLGRFTVGERLGRGGHGTVHRAWDERLCRWVAVKEIPDVAGGSARKRVARECHATARLNHPGIVTLYEMGAHGGSVLLISEYVDGADVRELAAHGGLSDRDVAELGAEICSALAHAHREGVVHRDVKPDNILHRRRGGYLLADFGIAGMADAPTLTATGEVLGTLTYMSPEQALGEQAGPPSDVYSLGLTLYELWGGENPVARHSPAATARAIGEEILPLGELRPELPEELCVAVDRCLEADPELRPGTRELSEVLLDVRGELHPDRAIPLPATMEDESRRIEVRSLPGLVARTLLAPLLGLGGIAPAFLAVASRESTSGRRAASAAVAWVVTMVAASLLGRSLGIPASPPDALAIGLTWVGGAVLLGLLLDVAPAAAAALGGLVWAGAVVALSGAAGEGTTSALLAPALLIAVGWAIWDREGRPQILGRSAGSDARGAPREARPAADLALVEDLPHLPDRRDRARRVADSHVRAALHGAGSRAGVS